MSVKRVLIFDSGVGGLSVYEQIIKINPSIQCQYLFDNAYFPYGELKQTQLVARLTQLLTDFLGQYPADLIVIACNSASTVALKALRQHFTIPIVGVVPAIKPASAVTRNNVIGLLATPGTIARDYTQQLITQFAAGKTVLSIGSTQLVKLAEDKLMGKELDQNEFLTILAPWLNQQVTMPDTLVLGCTHFPLLKAEIQKCFEMPIKLIDSGEAIALRVKQLLGEDQEPKVSCAEEHSHHAFYTKHFNNTAQLSALSHRFAEYGFRSLNYF
ncbi:glutamate racemase [Psychromonas sp. 14N.309.X.WAT.B.A12]|uniref:glutamate racemase n=1 Tax=Psychromonas sp. 14N.309.X.WAT.B.A12 TaxID=2998322 RepID=UPI0025B1EA35|nr:glutamate racemase [Psychromonas sp. 14N.309.X.WAT.B.A12]MDN2662616.1 glutamate racemase [Psychromonas sp. 14N.309.X.WAT.B.A12]